MTPKQSALCAKLAEAYIAENWITTDQQVEVEAFTAGFRAATERAEVLVRTLEMLCQRVRSRGDLRGTGDWSFKICGDEWYKAIADLDKYEQTGGVDEST